MANSWGESGTTWGQGDWGQQNVTTVVISSGLSITATLGEAQSYPEQGWGSDSWGDENWGESGIDILPTGYSITASLGELPYAGATDGWGRDEWGYGDWGQNVTTVIVDGLEMTTGLGPGGWGIAPWEEQVSWGGDLSLQTTQLSVVTLTGIEATASLGTPQINYDFIFTLSESLLGTLSLGAPTGTDMAIGVSGFAITGSLGTLGHEMTYALTGIEATMSLGTVAVTSNPLVPVSGFAITGSLGSLPAIDDMQIGVSGYSITGSLGTTTVTDMAIGVSGLEITGNLGSGGVAPLGYKDVDITGNTSYTYVEHAS